MEDRQTERYFGADQDIGKLVSTHLFVIGPNQSGSTFVTRAIERCAATWSLSREGQHMLGYHGPDTLHHEIPLTWASSPKSVDFMRSRASYDWGKTRKAWYFQAQAVRRDASIFVTKSPPFLLITDQLAEHFERVRFLFLIRNPYAVVEGICRRTIKQESERTEALGMAARHIMTCFEYQKRNIQAYQSTGLFLSYESICSQPLESGQKLQGLVPELTGLDFDQRIAVKGMYDEQLRNMNDDHIGRLSPQDIRTVNKVFVRKLDLMRFFGYELLTDI
jgi:hypothetical protein